MTITGLEAKTEANSISQLGGIVDRGEPFLMGEGWKKELPERVDACLLDQGRGSDFTESKRGS